MQSLFEEIGGKFITSYQEMQERLGNIQAFVFDWDGVFNAGQKGGQAASTFSEADSMGTNLMRFSFWLKKKKLPIIAIISGADNPIAKQLAEREHFNAVFLKTKEKKKAILQLCEIHNLTPSQIACSFDDVNDLPMSEVCGLRFLIHRPTSPLFSKFTQEKYLCDYQTSVSGGEHAVREVCELVMSLQGNFEEVVQHRVVYNEVYQKYFQQRQEVEVSYLSSN